MSVTKYIGGAKVGQVVLKKNSYLKAVIASYCFYCRPRKEYCKEKVS
jgi:hypothetical protein